MENGTTKTENSYHCAAVVHQFDSRESNDLPEYFDVETLEMRVRSLESLALVFSFWPERNEGMQIFEGSGSQKRVGKSSLILVFHRFYTSFSQTAVEKDIDKNHRCSSTLVTV